MSDLVLSDAADGVLLITINRPDARNAIDAATAQAMADALDRLDADDDVAVGIITGAGGTFSAGMDLKAFMAGESPTVADRGLAGITQWSPVKPVIAAVEGWAVGGGCEIALACDLIVAGEGARFGLPEVTRGLLAAAGGLVRLPQRLPYHVAMEAALTGDPIDAATAHRHGLVNRVAADGQAVAVARELAARIVANGPLAVRASKRIVQEGTSYGEDWPTRQLAHMAAVFTSEDAKEGPRAFAEKRPPRWQGR